MNTIVSHSKLANSDSESADMVSGKVKPANDGTASNFSDTLQSNAATDQKEAAIIETSYTADAAAQPEQQPDSNPALSPAAAADIIANLLAQAEKQLGASSATNTGAPGAVVSTAENSVAASGNTGMRETRLMSSGAAATPVAAADSQTASTQSADNARFTALLQQRSQSPAQQDLVLTGSAESRSAGATPSLQTLIAGLSADGAANSAAGQSGSSQQVQNAAAPVEWASVKLPQGQQGKWGEQMIQVLQDRVQLQASQNLQEARIRLDPPDLGKLDLTVRMDGDRLSVQIHASQSAVRDALVQVSERLRAELQEQNFVHVDVNVGDGRQGQQQEHAEEDAQPVIFANHQADDSQITTTDSGHWLSTRA
ncbi:flagellar hook-length control protein FliK [Photobacterium halotolerans]|uniref:flagellar hook-length control protein FliK n=1 Tax=Photobacterium halotolerans TaxID=265726 RepID=UPI001F27F327|nr:flagellar hook-length control protein FliK [Photobacterium halotolerans]